MPTEPKEMVSPGKRTAVFYENSDEGSNAYLELMLLQSVKYMELLSFFDDFESSNRNLFIWKAEGKICDDHHIYKVDSKN